jgi:hypothetical protein
MKRSRFYLGLVLLLGLLCVVNFFESKEVKTTNVTEAQVGWALSKYAARNPPGGAWDVATKAGWTATGIAVGAKYGATLGSFGGPIGAVGGAMAGAL